MNADVTFVWQCWPADKRRRLIETAANSAEIIGLSAALSK